MNKYKDNNELFLIFDWYDVPGGQASVVYHITDTIIIGKTTMKKLLFSVKTKMDLTAYWQRN